MNIATVAFVTEKAPQGGCALKQIKFELDAEGKPTVLSLETIAYCTTLIEANEIESRMKKEVFAEEALSPPIERVHYLPAPLQHQPSPQQHYGPLEDRPKVLNDMDNQPQRDPDVSLVERAKRAMDGRNGRANAIVFAAFVTLAMAAHSMGLRA